MLLGLACASCANAPTADSSSAPPMLIAVDVGHSKEHPGAISARGVPEFEFNSILAKGVVHTLEGERQKTVLIGGDGDMNNLFKRTDQASAAGAGFFLSIHHDSVKQEYLKPWDWHGAEHHYADGKFKGFGLFVSRKNPYLQKSLKCASAIGFKLEEAGFRHSTYHADPVIGDGREWADQQNGVYYFDDLIVLKTARQPAVLFEAGVIVNRDEEAGLANKEVQERMAKAIRAGLQACGVVGAG
jgi:N-acetylmuramoyl-L-alanine amidase